MKIKRIIAENYKTYKALGLNLESMAMTQAAPRRPSVARFAAGMGLVLLEP